MSASVYMPYNHRRHRSLLVAMLNDYAFDDNPLFELSAQDKQAKVLELASTFEKRDGRSYTVCDDGRGNPCVIVGVQKARQGQIDYAEIAGIHTLSEYRRRGYARALLKTIVRDLHFKSPGLPIVAWVHKDNEASQKLFDRAGLPDSGRRDANGRWRMGVNLP